MHVCVCTHIKKKKKKCRWTQCIMCEWPIYEYALEGHFNCYDVSPFSQHQDVFFNMVCQGRNSSNCITCPFCSVFSNARTHLVCILYSTGPLLVLFQLAFLCASVSVLVSETKRLDISELSCFLSLPP